MFETCDVHENRSFNPFRPPDVRQWSAVSLNLDLAWFVLTTYVREEGVRGPVEQDPCVRGQLE